MRSLVLIAHNIRSCHNIGSLLRTADGLAVYKVYLTGYTPYPSNKLDKRLPHLRQKIDRQIHKTALGAEHSVAWEQHDDIEAVLTRLRQAGYRICALEQAKQAILLPKYTPPRRLALLVGSEVTGLDQAVLALTDDKVVIPMLGSKESFNVVQAAAMALYHMRFVA